MRSSGKRLKGELRPSKIMRWVVLKIMPPFQGFGAGGLETRALPWAGLRRPFRPGAFHELVTQRLVKAEVFSSRKRDHSLSSRGTSEERVGERSFLSPKPKKASSV